MCALISKRTSISFATMASEDTVCKIVVAITLIAVVVYLSVHLCRSCGLLTPLSAKSCPMGAARNNFVTMWGTPRSEIEAGGRLPLNISQFTRQGMTLQPGVVGVPRGPMHCSPYDLTCGNGTLFPSQGLRLTGSDVLEQTRSRAVGAPPRSCPIDNPTCGGAQGTTGPSCHVSEPCCGNLPTECYPFYGCYDPNKVPIEQYTACLARADAKTQAAEQLRRSGKSLSEFTKPCHPKEPCCGNLPTDCYPYNGCYDSSKVPEDQYMACMAAKDAAAEAAENIRRSRMTQEERAAADADSAAAMKYAGETLGDLAVGSVGLRSTGARRVSTLLQKPVSPSTARKQVRITPELGASTREFIQPGRITRYSKNDDIDRASAGGNVFA